jgi:hypothetical protein
MLLTVKDISQQLLKQLYGRPDMMAIEQNALHAAQMR